MVPCLAGIPLQFMFSVVENNEMLNHFKFHSMVAHTGISMIMETWLDNGRLDIAHSEVMSVFTRYGAMAFSGNVRVLGSDKYLWKNYVIRCSFPVFSQGVFKWEKHMMSTSIPYFVELIQNRRGAYSYPSALGRRDKIDYLAMFGSPKRAPSWVIGLLGEDLVIFVDRFVELVESKIVNRKYFEVN
jgi:hypothetical protein